MIHPSAHNERGQKTRWISGGQNRFESCSGIFQFFVNEKEHGTRTRNDPFPLLFLEFVKYVRFLDNWQQKKKKTQESFRRVGKTNLISSFFPPFFSLIVESFGEK